MDEHHFLPTAFLVAVLLLGIGCNDDDTTQPSAPTDDQAIRAALAGLAYAAEAHDIDAFMDYFHPDFMQGGMDRDQLREGLADPGEGLAAIRLLTFDVDSVSVAGDRALVTMTTRVEFLDGRRDVASEPSYRGPGLGWWARLAGRWLLYGGHKYSVPWPAVGHTDDAPPADYTLQFNLETSKPITVATVSGPGIDETVLSPRLHDEGVTWEASVVPSAPPVAGNRYIFQALYTDGKADTLEVPIASIVDYLPPFEVTAPVPCTIQVDWPDSSCEVPDAICYRVWAKCDLQPDATGSNDLPLTQTSYTITEGLTPGFTYKVRLEIYDSDRSWAGRTRYITVQ